MASTRSRRGQSSAKHLLDDGKELLANGQEAIESFGCKVRDQVSDRPMTSVMVASGIGLLIGLLLGRKN